MIAYHSRVSAVIQSRISHIPGVERLIVIYLDFDLYLCAWQIKIIIICFVMFFIFDEST